MAGTQTSGPRPEILRGKKNIKIRVCAKMLFSVFWLGFFAWTLHLYYTDFSLLWRQVDERWRMQRKAYRFSRTVLAFFEISNDDEKLEFVERSSHKINEFVRLVLSTCAEDLQPQFHRYVLVLLLRHNIFPVCSTMDELMQRASQLCHQRFMILVLQLRTYGEVQSIGSVSDFETSFREFCRLADHRDLLRRMEELGFGTDALDRIVEEVRHIVVEETASSSLRDRMPDFVISG